MKKFFHFIVNQNSRNSDAVFKKVLLELPNYTRNYKIHITDNIGQLEQTIKKLKGSIQTEDIIVTVGGDGSLNQTITFLEKYAIPNYLGYIPSGSGNDFARANAIPIKTKAALAHLFSVSKPRERSIIHATQGEENLYAVNSLGIGIDGLVIHMTSEGSRKKMLGPFSYISGLLQAFAKQDKFPVTLKVDEGIYTFENVQLALVANNAYFGGGIQIVPEADSSDDVLEVVIAEDVNASQLMNIVSRLLSTQSHLRHPHIHTFQSKQVALYTEAFEYAQKDGESFKQDGYALTFNTIKRSFWM